MNYFVFECENCHERIEAANENAGQKINCPHCDGPVTVPPPTPISAEPDGAAPAAVNETEPTPVLGLTTEIKVELVSFVRDLVGDGSRWVPGLDDSGKNVMGAARSGETLVPLKSGTAGITHYSIVGAFLHALAERNVTLTAAGRSRFLNTELPEAAARAIGQPSAAGTTANPMELNHQECLGLLDELTASYSDMFQNRLATEKLAGKTKDTLVALVNNPDHVPDPGELAAAVLASVRSLEDRLQMAESQIKSLKRQLSGD